MPQRPLSELVSPNETCRRYGCLLCIPSFGSYPGMPQSHCPRCGMRNWSAHDQCPDFIEPLYPDCPASESDGYWVHLRGVIEKAALIGVAIFTITSLFALLVWVFSHIKVTS